MRDARELMRRTEGAAEVAERVGILNSTFRMALSRRWQSNLRMSQLQ